MLRFIASDFVATRFLARSVGPDINFINMRDILDTGEVIKVTMRDLENAQKKLVQDNLDTFQKLCLESF